MPDIVNSEDLIRKFTLNTCTREEMNKLLKIIGNEKDEYQIAQILKAHWDRSAINDDKRQTEAEGKFAILMKEIKKEVPVIPIAPGTKGRSWHRRLAAAAIIICIISAGAYLLFNYIPSRQTAKAKNIVQEKNNNEILPGKNAATLTLADGTTVILNEAHNGTVSTQGNTKILKVDDGTLSYNPSGNNAGEILYNTISTPKGGQYQLQLSDGSKVWLNAASSLRFPATFIGNERKVALLGEAYFEVAKNTSMPFKVETDGMEVEVLGTHFNINSYNDESTIRTTLLEGSVKVNGSEANGFLKPGQQAKLERDGEIKIINNADVEEAIAWKEGKFQFDRADIYTVMRQIKRWYDVNIEYKGIVSSHFGGTISRNVNLSQVLKMLQLTGEVKFQVEDRKVVVIPNVL